MRTALTGNGSYSGPRIRALSDSRIYHRRTIRLPGRDYSADGAYFVTTYTIDRAPLFGDVVDGRVCLNSFGNIVADSWRWLPSRYPYVALDEWCVMRDHLHGILVLGDKGGSRTAPTGDRLSTGGDMAMVDRKPLGGLIGAFKTVSTKHINGLRNTPGAVVWQRGFWDHVVRDHGDLARIRIYIRENAANVTPDR